MDSSHYVVLDDRTGEFWEGALVERARAHALRARGVVTLPVEPTLLTRSGVGGYFKRSWGSGWPLGTAIPKMGCPMILYAVRTVFDGAPDGLNRISWVARLVAESSAIVDGVRAGTHRLNGQLRLAPDASQLGTHAGGFTATPHTARAADQFGKPDVDDGWTVYGEASLHAPADAFFACGLYGHIQGLRVAWCAVSQSR